VACAAVEIHKRRADADQRDRERSNGVKNWDWPLSAALAADSKKDWRISGAISVFCMICNGQFYDGNRMV
jgi:hypothetical protein